MATARLPVSASRFFTAFYRLNKCSIACVRHQNSSRTLHTTPPHSRSISSIKRRLHISPAPKQSPELEKKVIGEQQEAHEFKDNGTSDTTRVDVKSKSAVADKDTRYEGQYVGPRTCKVTDSPPLPLPKIMRKIMRSVPHPLMIITAGYLDSVSGKTSYQGMTVSSFTTVTMEPTPIVSFNIRVPSRTLDAMRSNDGHFRVHAPSTTLFGAEIAVAFTKGDAAGAFSSETLRNAEVRYPLDSSGSRAPYITRDMSFAFSCKVLGDIPVEDHVLIVAKVTKVDFIDKDMKKPLLYAGGTFQKGLFLQRVTEQALSKSIPDKTTQDESIKN